MWDRPAWLNRTAAVLTVASLLALFYAGVLAALRHPGLLPLHRVSLQAAPQHVSVDAVRTVLRERVAGNLLTVDIEQVRLALEQLPWVRRAEVRRVFPDSLAVRLDEHEALGRWDAARLVNTHGELFVATSDAALPAFSGRDADAPEMVRQYGVLQASLAQIGQSIARMALSERHAWQLELGNGVVLALGREEVERRLARLVAMYPYSLAEQKVAYVDLRYRNGMAVRWASGS